MKRSGPLRRTARLEAKKPWRPRRKRLPAKSAKTAERDRQLDELTRSWLVADRRCHVRSRVCIGTASCLHHIAARSTSPQLILEPTNLIRSCHPCNSFIETAEGAAWAELAGLKRRSWDIPLKRG